MPMIPHFIKVIGAVVICVIVVGLAVMSVIVNNEERKCKRDRMAY